ncbi:hypothetical protein [Novibacillus thermophilus]|uniref:hypothetical protein n=1 Tax=Novibacillus thermophilus TaxID=1471761 RepID=UPI00098BA02E|nr:hypothetical protein [Novibacillus thermophilus]
MEPDAPYQYCQYHYLKDITKPVEEKDRKLKTSVKKSLRGIRQIERQVAEQESLEAEVDQDYAAAIRSVLLEDGKPPLDLSGVRTGHKRFASPLKKKAWVKRGLLFLNVCSELSAK